MLNPRTTITGIVTSLSAVLAALAALSPVDQGLIAQAFPQRFHAPVIAFFVLLGAVSHIFGQCAAQDSASNGYRTEWVGAGPSPWLTAVIVAVAIGLLIGRVFVNPGAPTITDIYKDGAHLFIGGLFVAWRIQGLSWQRNLFWIMCAWEVFVAVGSRLIW